MNLPESLECKQSPIAGLGIFANQYIPKGTKLGKYTGVKYSYREFTEKYGKDFRYCYFTSRSWLPIICAKESRHFMTYINESESPNVYFSRYYLYSGTDIQPGEEITLKYPKKYPRNY